MHANEFVARLYAPFAKKAIGTSTSPSNTSVWWSFVGSSRIASSLEGGDVEEDVEEEEERAARSEFFCSVASQIPRFRLTSDGLSFSKRPLR